MKLTKLFAFTLLTLLALLALPSCGECTHEDTEWNTITEATCSAEGVRNSVCKDCGTILKTENIDKIAHKEVVDAAKAPTCTATGLTEGKHCSVCGTVTVAQQETDTIPHIESDWINDKETTNTGEGLRHTECIVCGKRMSEESIPENDSVGLAYRVNSDNESCTITGIGDCTDSKIIIPASINGYTVSAVGDYALFSGCDSLTSIVIPDSVTSIGEWAFSGCSSLTSVVIPDSVTSIGEDAFRACYKLVEVINKSSLNIVAGSLSYGYVARYAKEVHNGESKIVNQNDYLFYTYNGVNYLLGYVGNDTELVLPTSYNGANYEIYKYAFYENKKIASIEIPDSVTSIPYGAFSGCSSLTSIVIPDSVTSISSSAFSSCDSLTSIVIPDSVTSIGEYAFYRCTSLTSVVIGDSVTSIGESAFSHCKSLTSVVIGDSVASIGERAFSSCDSLTSIVIGDSVTSIGGEAFVGCRNLTSIKIPNSVTNIGKGAFYGCTSLTSVVIGDSVTSIGERAFYVCTSLTSVVIPDGVTSIGESAFHGCTSLTIYCEAESRSSGWDSNWNSQNRPVVWGYKG